MQRLASTVDWLLAASPYARSIHPAEIGIAGHSYGGFAAIDYGLSGGTLRPVSTIAILATGLHQRGRPGARRKRWRIRRDAIHGRLDTPGFASYPRDCQTLPCQAAERRWDGDELAEGLERALAGRTDPLKPLPVDLERLSEVHAEKTG